MMKFYLIPFLAAFIIANAAGIAGMLNRMNRNSDKPVKTVENICTAQPDKPEKITITITTTCR